MGLHSGCNVEKESIHWERLNGLAAALKLSWPWLVRGYYYTTLHGVQLDSELYKVSAKSRCQCNRTQLALQRTMDMTLMD